MAYLMVEAHQILSSRKIFSCRHVRLSMRFVREGYATLAAKHLAYYVVHTPEGACFVFQNGSEFGMDFFDWSKCRLFVSSFANTIIILNIKVEGWTH